MMDKVDFSDLISQKEAAEIRNVSRSAINELIKRGRLQVQEIGGKKFLSRKEVSDFEGQQGKRLEKEDDAKRKTGRLPKVKDEQD